MPKKVLVLSSEKDCSALKEILGEEYKVILAQDRAEVKGAIFEDHPAVVLCGACTTIDGIGNWEQAYNLISEVEYKPPFIVCSKHVDYTLWINALEKGAYDVLLKPFNREEVVRVVGYAADKQRFLS